jgi:hypothetical protein
MVVMVSLIASSIWMISADEGRGEPTREGSVDLTGVLNYPMEGGSYQTELGLSVNITIRNIGNITANGTGRASLVIKDNNTGQVAHSATTPNFTNITPGGELNLTFQNWTTPYAGQFKLNVSVLYVGDSNQTNNYIESYFSMWTKNWPFPPKLDSWKVEPKKGDTDTDFTYTAEYNFNEPPEELRVEIDGINYTMTEKDPDDDIYQDGKLYTLVTKLPIGNHRYRIFAKVDGWKDLSTDNISFPWVNLSLKDPQVAPTKGYVTTPFRFSVLYGSFSSLPPDEMIVRANGKDFNMTMVSPTPIYIRADVKFEAEIKGIDLLPTPLEYSYRVKTGNDTYSLGPFQLEGPTDQRINITGTVTDLEMEPIEGVLVQLATGEETTTDSMGRYQLQAYKGYSHMISYSRNGFLGREYSIDLLEDRNLDIQLEPLPVGASVSGYVLMGLKGDLKPIQGVLINISNPAYSNETISGSDGYYIFEDVPAGTGYLIRASEERFRDFTYTLDIENGAIIKKNITLVERDMNVSVDPSPEGGRIDVDRSFKITLPEMPDIDSVNISLVNKTSSIPFKWENPDNTTLIEVMPFLPLNFDEVITLTIGEGLVSISGQPVVWRDIRLEYITRIQESLDEPTTSPLFDQISVALDAQITISWGIGLNMSSFSYELIELAGLKTVEGELSHIDTVNWSDSGRTDTVVRIIPSNLTFDTRYSLEVAGGLSDIYGNILFTSTYVLEFTTVGEPDEDGDGVVDSEDAFPSDPNEWSDLDGDGRGDQVADAFPMDADEWDDTDGDSIGNNEDTDDDNDGMPDKWELDNGLNPLNASDAFLDKDGDGAVNLDEYLEGTDPGDKDSKPKEGESEIPLVYLIAGVVILILVALAAVMIVIRTRDSGNKYRDFEE